MKTVLPAPNPSSPRGSMVMLAFFMLAAGIPTAFPKKSCCAIGCLERTVGSSDKRPVDNTFDPGLIPTKYTLDSNSENALTENVLVGNGPTTVLASAPLIQLVSQQKGTLTRLGSAQEFPAGADWLNVKRPLNLQGLKGKLVLLDFWTYCCINCMHVLPVLKQAEESFAKDLVVIGVHTAKFTTEADTQNIRNAVMRYDVHHPVMNDKDHQLWNAYGVDTWPTLILIDPEGFVIWKHSGEIPYKDLERVLKQATAKYAKNLSGKSIPIELEKGESAPTPLRFPGKIIADPTGDRLFIADSNHHRIVIAKVDGSVLETIGSGNLGSRDGVYAEAQFNHPQGMALDGNQLYIADTENHLIRKVDLESKLVTTIAGTGAQLTTAFPGHELTAPLPNRFVKNPKTTPLGSPWDLWVHQGQLYIAMAGPHQIWKLDLSGKGLVHVAGNGREDIVDGPLKPKRPYSSEGSSFAQPSGLASDGTRLFVADSEGSSIRIVPFDEKSMVETLLGTAKLTTKRLFSFGDRDGGVGNALFQHPLGLVFHEKKLYVADTYNHKVKRVDLETRVSETLIGNAKPGASDQPPMLNEPAGLAVVGNQLFIADTNNHVIRRWDLREGKLTTLKLDGLQPPKQEAPKSVNSLPAEAIRVAQQPIAIPAGTKKLDCAIDLKIPKGWKLNAEAPLGYIVLARRGKSGDVLGNGIRELVQPPKNAFTVSIPLPEGADFLEIGVTHYFCRANGQGVCLADTVVFELPLEISKDAESVAPVLLQHAIKIPLGQL